MDVLTSERNRDGVFILFTAAAAPDHLCASKDDQEDRPRDGDESRRQRAGRSQEEVEADEDEHDRQYFVVRAVAHWALADYLCFFHKKLKIDKIYYFDL